MNLDEDFYQETYLVNCFGYIIKLKVITKINLYVLIFEKLIYNRQKKEIVKLEENNIELLKPEKFVKILGISKTCVTNNLLSIWILFSDVKNTYCWQIIDVAFEGGAFYLYKLCLEKKFNIADVVFPIKTKRYRFLCQFESFYNQFKINIWNETKSDCYIDTAVQLTEVNVEKSEIIFNDTIHNNDLNAGGLDTFYMIVIINVKSANNEMLLPLLIFEDNKFDLKIKFLSKKKLFGNFYQIDSKISTFQAVYCYDLKLVYENGSNSIAGNVLIILQSYIDQSFKLLCLCDSNLVYEKRNFLNHNVSTRVLNICRQSSEIDSFLMMVEAKDNNKNVSQLYSLKFDRFKAYETCGIYLVCTIFMEPMILYGTDDFTEDLDSFDKNEKHNSTCFSSYNKYYEHNEVLTMESHWINSPIYSLKKLSQKIAINGSRLLMEVSNETEHKKNIVYQPNYIKLLTHKPSPLKTIYINSRNINNKNKSRLTKYLSKLLDKCFYISNHSLIINLLIENQEK